MIASLMMLARLLSISQDPAWPESPTILPSVEVVARPRVGVVLVECRVSREGTVGDCVILSETPAGHGFGAAALNGARRARMTPGSVRNVAVGGTVRFTTRFRLSEEESADDSSRLDDDAAARDASRSDADETSVPLTP